MMPTMSVGRFSVTRIEEMLTPGFLPGFLFPDFSADVLDEHPELLAANFWHAGSGKVMSSMHSWLLRDGTHTILIDTGCGNRKSRALPMFQRFHMLELPYLDHLAAAGVRPEEVTLVINTHLHIDHVGWNTQLVDGRWVPTFPNARYIFGAQEFAHWRSTEGGLVKLPENGPVIEDSVMPVIEAGQAELVADDATILYGISVEPAPGHTAGQFMVKVTSGRGAIVFSGDCIHQPMQVYRPDWNSRFCEDAAAARITRRRLLDYCADRGALIMPAHFGAPHGGHVRRSGEGYRFEPAFDVAWSR
jgi:glyoxylase-like metal-dependent hydrolase (beta-lactamase superfamily II)